MIENNHDVSDADNSRANAINNINAAASTLNKPLLNAGDVAVGHAAGQIATAAAIVYLGDCLRQKGA